MRWEPEADPAQNARRVLPRLAREFFDAGNKVAKPGVSAKRLHSFRIEAKHFRYTLELFRPLYGPGLDQRLATLRRVQDVLGELNDCQTARSMDAVRSDPTFLAWIENRLADRRARFLSTWASEFPATSFEQRWVFYLRRYARWRPKT